MLLFLLRTWFCLSCLQDEPTYAEIKAFNYMKHYFFLQLTGYCVPGIVLCYEFSFNLHQNRHLVKKVNVHIGNIFLGYA